MQMKLVEKDEEDDTAVFVTLQQIGDNSKFKEVQLTERKR